MLFYSNNIFSITIVIIIDIIIHHMYLLVRQNIPSSILGWFNVADSFQRQVVCILVKLFVVED